MKAQEDIIQHYINGYNHFDIDKMVKDFDENIIFENISNGTSTMTLRGLVAFKSQAENAKSYFSEREQAIKSFKHQDNTIEIEIDYKAVLAMDFPNGLKKGDVLQLQGKSLFEFSGTKIIKLTDIS